MCKKTKLFTGKSFLLLDISLPMSLDDMPPIAWGLLFSDLFVLFFCPYLEICLVAGDGDGLMWLGRPRRSPSSQQTMHEHHSRGLSRKPASKIAAERGAGTECFPQFVFVQEVASSF